MCPDWSGVPEFAQMAAGRPPEVELRAKVVKIRLKSAWRSIRPSETISAAVAACENYRTARRVNG